MSERLPTALLLTLTLPFVSAIVSAIIGRHRSWLAPLIATVFLLGTAISSLFFFFQSWGDAPSEFRVNWFYIGTHAIDFSISIQAVTLILLVTVSIISFLVHLFSIGYMVEDAGERRYFATLGIFTVAMQALIVSGNLLQLFVFWELVGVSSYFLIAHWRERPAAAQAATKAFIMNRIGDVGLLSGLALIWVNTGTLDLHSLAVLPQATWSTAIGVCLFLGVVGKSAQFPLLTWLPDAMEGPTPVSALIHAATMVAAGVFLLIRLHFAFTSDALIMIAITGAITSIYGAWHALHQFDIKKILAYSTLSQLGLMVLAFGAGAWEASYLHLFTHAFFKASLFLCAGAIIHGLHQAKPLDHDPQDIRLMGGLRAYMPNVFIAFLLAAGGLAGLPLFSGFLSKEAILTDLYLKAVGEQGSGLPWLWITIFFSVSFMTVVYSYRLVKTVFFGHFRSAHQIPKIERTPMIMVLPVAILSMCSVWWLVSPNPFHTDSWFLQALNHEPAALPLWFFGISILWLVLALSYSFFKYRSNPTEKISRTGHLDTFYNQRIVRPALQMAAKTERVDKNWIDPVLHSLVYAQVSLGFIISWFDRKIVDGVVTLGALLFRSSGNALRFLGAGQIQGYLLWAMVGFVIFLFWMLK